MARSATETRSRILTAAGNLFSSHGYCGTSLDDIVTAAGITKGAFYHYFKSKEEVCLALLDQALAQAGRLSETSAANPPEALRNWARRLVDPEQSEISNMFRLVLRLSGDLPLFNDPIPDKIRRFWNEQAACLEALIAACPSRNPACKDARQAALLILSAFVGALRFSQTRLPNLEPDQLLETAIKLVVQ
jgi:AcrR family transcriptional regulator